MTTLRGIQLYNELITFIHKIDRRVSSKDVYTNMMHNEILKPIKYSVYSKHHF